MLIYLSFLEAGPAGPLTDSFFFLLLFALLLLGGHHELDSTSTEAAAAIAITALRMRQTTHCSLHSSCVHA
jgi:hypothetical protein